jgi:hypothetical protein
MGMRNFEAFDVRVAVWDTVGTADKHPEHQKQARDPKRKTLRHDSSGTQNNSENAIFCVLDASNMKW